MRKAPCAAWIVPAFSLGDEKGFEWIEPDITADELLPGQTPPRLESKTAQAQMLILNCWQMGKRMPSGRAEKAVNERGISRIWRENGKEPYRGQTCDRERRAQHGSAISRD